MYSFVTVTLLRMLNHVNHHVSSRSHREASVSRDLSRQFHHRVSGSLSRVQHRGRRRRRGRRHRDAPGHARLHLPAARPHRVPRRFPRLHRARPHRAVHDGGPGARRSVSASRLPTRDRLPLEYFKRCSVARSARSFSAFTPDVTAVCPSCDDVMSCASASLSADS